MLVRASIEPLSWENTFFGVNSAIVRFDQHAPVLTADALQPWSRVQAKIPAANTQELDALQQLGFSLVEGEVDFVLPVTCAHGDPGAQVAQTTDIPALRHLAGQAFAQSRFRPRGMPQMPARVFMRSGLKTRCWGRSIINASFFVHQQVRFVAMSRCVN